MSLIKAHQAARLGLTKTFESLRLLSRSTLSDCGVPFPSQTLANVGEIKTLLFERDGGGFMCFRVYSASNSTSLVKGVVAEAW